MITALYIFLFYLFGVVLAVFFARFYNGQPFRRQLDKVPPFGCLLSWFLVVVGIAVFTYETKFEDKIKKFVNYDS